MYIEQAFRPGKKSVRKWKRDRIPDACGLGVGQPVTRFAVTGGHSHGKHLFLDIPCDQNDVPMTGEDILLERIGLEGDPSIQTAERLFHFSAFVYWT